MSLAVNLDYYLGCSIANNCPSATNLVQSCCLQDGHTIDKFLHAHAKNSNHGETSVAEFLAGQVGKALGGRVLESDRVKSNVSWVVLFTKREHLFVRLDPPNVGTPGLSKVDGQEEGQHDSQWDKGQLVVSNHRVVSTKRNGRRVLGNEIANDRHHGDSAVHHLSLANALDFIKGLILGETEGIEKTEGGNGPRKSKAGFGTFIAMEIVIQ